MPLPAELVLSLHDESTYGFLRDRYFMDLGEPSAPMHDMELATWRIVEALDSMFDHDLVVAETHPGGGQYDCISLVEMRDGYGRPVVDLNREGRIHIHAAGGLVSLEDGWDRALGGQAESVAADLASALALAPLAERRQSATRTYWRAVELGRRAGEMLRWRIDENADLRHHGDILNLFAHRLERHGPQYVDAGLPSIVFTSTYSG